MANPVRVLPDPMLLLIQYLRLRPEVTALVDPASIKTTIPTTPTYPYVLMTWGGGAGIWPAVDDSAIQVDVIGGEKDTCSLIARTVRAAVWAIANDTVAAGVLSSGSEEVGPQWLPDTTVDPPLSRFTARYRIISHP